MPLKKEILQVCENDVSCCHGESILQNNKCKKRHDEEAQAWLKDEARPQALIIKHLLSNFNIKAAKWDKLSICTSFQQNNEKCASQMWEWEIVCHLFGGGTWTIRMEPFIHAAEWVLSSKEIIVIANNISRAEYWGSFWKVHENLHMFSGGFPCKGVISWWVV